jgi:hypothetical protein
MMAGLAALLVFNVAWLARDLFGTWRTLPAAQTAYQTRLAQLAHYLDLTAGTTPSLVCVSDLETLQTPELGTPEMLALMMHRQSAPIRYANCGTAMVFTSGGETAQVIFPDEGGMFDVHSSIRAWLSQGRFVMQRDVPRRSVVLMDVSETLADRIGGFTSTAWAWYAPESPGGAAQVFPPIRFGGNVTFLGYEPFEGLYKPGDYVTVVSYWRVDGQVPPDLRLFTHVLFDPQQIAAQTDALNVSQPQLLPRDVVMQVTFVRLPRAMPEGAYSISIGAYEDNADLRLNVFDGDTPRGTRLFLGDITVERADE